MDLTSGSSLKPYSSNSSKARLSPLKARSPASVKMAISSVGHFDMHASMMDCASPMLLDVA